MWVFYSSIWSRLLSGKIQMSECVEIDCANKIIAVFYVIVILLDSSGDSKRELSANRTDSVRTSGRYKAEVVSVLMKDRNRVRIVLVGWVRLQVAIKVSDIGGNTIAVIDTGYIVVVQHINASISAVWQFFRQRTVIGHVIHRCNGCGISVHLRLSAHLDKCYKSVRFRK